MTISVLVVFQSAEGHTATVAHHIANTIAGAGVRVTVEPVAAAPPPVGFDVVVLGDSIHLGHHSRGLARYVASHRTQLAEVPLALFQVSLTSARDDDESVARATEMLEEFCEHTGLEPERVGLFAGALSYTRYRGVKRWLMRRIAAEGGLDEDVAVDHVYTDWAEVEAFAHAALRIARDASAAGATPAAVAPFVDYEVPVVEPTTVLAEVVEALVANDTGLVLVVSPDADPLCTESLGGVVGVVSERDIVAAVHDGADLSLVWAADVMSTRLVTLPGSRTVDEVARAMVDHHVRHVVVPGSAGRPGVVSMRSLVGQVAAPD